MSRVVIRTDSGELVDAVRCDICREVVLRPHGRRIYCGVRCRQTAFYRRHRDVQNPRT